MSISSSYPTQRPSLNLVFNGGSDQLDSRISFSRADTPPTYAAPSAVHYWSNEKHLSSENLLPYSNDLSQSVWTKRNLTVPVTNIVAPDGTSSASSLLETTATSTHDFYEEFSAVSGASYTFTLYAKANGRDTLHVSPQATSTIASVVFDLTAVTSTVVSGSADSHSISAIGSTGWYKLQVTVTATGSGTGFLQTYFKVGGTTSYAGDATKGAYIWGCQVSSTGETVLNETSGGIHRSYASTLKSVANAGDPRFEYSPADGQSVGTALGLLVESQATNYNTKSEDIAGWSAPGNMTVSANAMVAPNGTLTADVLTVSDDTVASGHFAYNVVTGGSSGDSVAVSFYAKSTGVDEIYFYDNVVAGPSLTIFNISNGTVSGANSANSKIIDCGNGWYHCVGVYTLTASHPSLRFYSYSGSSTTYIGNGFDGFALWGVQVEIGVSSESSYISTSGSTVSRAADSCSVDLNGILASGQDVTLYAEGDWGDYTVKPYNRFLAALSENTDPSWIALYNAGSSGASYIKYENNLEAVQTGVAASGNQKAAVSVAMNSIKHAAAGVASAEDTSATVPSYTQLNIGNNRDAGTLSLNGHCSRVMLYGQALSSSELATLTS